METLMVALGERAYPIHVGRALFSRSDLLRPFLRQPKVAVVTNTTVAVLYLRPLLEALRHAGIEAIEIVLPDGEQFKDWQTLNSIFDLLLRHHCERSTTLIALGGGVIGDMTGFAAACFQRGVAFIQIPTTLLAQVDSSVGGKTAINHPLGKNMIGAFHQPALVLADTDTLNTLPARELRAGLAEVIKYGLIRDLAFFEWLEANLDALLLLETDALIEAVCRSCRNKAEVVVADEKERGERALLNLGHTFGHAIETGLGYGQWLHGEAIAAGTLMAAQLSVQIGWLSQPELARTECLFRRAGLPVRGPALAVDSYVDLMRHDKKVTGGKLRLVLLQRIGRAVVTDAVPLGEVRRAIATRSPNG